MFLETETVSLMSFSRYTAEPTARRRSPLPASRSTSPCFRTPRKRYQRRGFLHIYLVQILVRTVDKGGSCDRDRSNLLSFHSAGIIDAVSALLAAVFECVVRNCDCGGFGHRAAEHNSAAAAAQIKGVPRNRTLVDCTIGHRDRTGLVCSIKGVQSVTVSSSPATSIPQLRMFRKVQ